MMRSTHESSCAKAQAIPVEIVNVLGTTGALLAATVAGAVIAHTLPASAAPWRFVGAYGGPSLGVFAIYGWLALRI